jgi:hypothetical protein
MRKDTDTPQKETKSKLALLDEQEIEEKEKEDDGSFIVRNILEGYHCVSDINLMFRPYEIMDLTTEKTEILQKSKDLRASIKKGILVKISRAEMDRLEEKEYQKEQVRIYSANQQERERRRIATENSDREFEAEEINLNRADSGHNDEATITGQSNDPATYASAYAAAQSEAESQGRTLDPEEFAEMVRNNPRIVKSIISSNRGVISGTTKRGRATVMTPPMNDGDVGGVATMNMTNFNRDRYIAGGEDTFSNMGGGYAEEIDLNLE